jgi:hypothetical protein
MVWSVLTTALAVGDEITVQLANSTAKHAMAAAAWSGLASSPVDKSSIGNATSGSSASPGATGTLAQADEVIVVAVATNQVAADTITTPSGYSLTEQLGTTSGSNDRRISLYERTVSSTATSTPSAALSSSTTWGAVLLTLKLAAAPPAGPTVTVLDVDGTTRLPATVKGVLDVDGTTLLPATLKGVVS